MNSTLVIGLAAALIVALIIVAVILWRRRGRAEGIQSALNSVAVASLRDVLIPNGMGGQIYIEYLVLTSRGIVVFDVKDFVGAVFASDRMQEWTVIGKGRRFGFPNPQGTLFDRVAAIRQVVSSVPVEGHILFSSQADFSKGRPKNVVLSSELEKRFSKPTKDDRERLSDAYAPYWAKLKAVSEPADSVTPAK